MIKKTYKVKGMDCDACAKMIELDLEDQNIKASCNYAKEVLEVEVQDKNDEEKIKTVVINSGYELTQL